MKWFKHEIQLDRSRDLTLPRKHPDWYTVLAMAFAVSFVVLATVGMFLTGV